MAKLEHFRISINTCVSSGYMSRHHLETFNGLLEALGLLDSAYTDAPGWKRRYEELLESLK